MDEFQTSIDVMWYLAGPALATTTMRACWHCEKPIEAATGERRLCDPCWRKRLRAKVRTCATCATECYGNQCRACKTKPKVSPIYFPSCVTCGCTFATRRPNAKTCPEHRGYQVRRTPFTCALCGAKGTKQERCRGQVLLPEMF